MRLSHWVSAIFLKSDHLCLALPLFFAWLCLYCSALLCQEEYYLWMCYKDTTPLKIVLRISWMCKVFGGAGCDGFYFAGKL